MAYPDQVHWLEWSFTLLHFERPQRHPCVTGVEVLPPGKTSAIAITSAASTSSSVSGGLYPLCTEQDAAGFEEARQAAPAAKIDIPRFKSLIYKMMGGCDNCALTARLSRLA